MLLLEMSPVLCAQRSWQCLNAMKVSQCLLWISVLTLHGPEWNTYWGHHGSRDYRLSSFVLFTVSVFSYCMMNFYQFSGLKQPLFMISQFPQVRSPEILSWVLCSGPHKMVVKHFHLEAQLGKNELPSSLRLLAKPVPCCCRAELPVPIGCHSPWAVHRHGCRFHQGQQMRVSTAVSFFKELVWLDHAYSGKSLFSLTWGQLIRDHNYICKIPSSLPCN